MSEEKSDYQCPTCGGFKVVREKKEHTFPYGHPKPVYFTVEVPVFRCIDKNCDGEQWMNWEADEIRDAYVEQWKNDQD